MKRQLACLCAAFLLLGTAGGCTPETPPVSTPEDASSEPASSTTITDMGETTTVIPTVPTESLYSGPVEAFRDERVLFDISEPVSALSLPSNVGIVRLDQGSRLSAVTGKQFGNHLSYANKNKQRDTSKPNFLTNIRGLGIGLFRFGPATTYTHDMSHDSMFEVAQQVGAEVVFVLSGYEDVYKLTGEEREKRLFTNNLKYAQDIHDKGYPCQYFELGNEVVYTPVKADVEQYARDYLKMREELRKIDPNFKLGASMFAYYTGESWSKESLTWADIFFDIVGDKCDFISPHIYYQQTVTGSFQNRRYGLDSILGTWKQKTKEKTGREIPIILTEWNLWIVNKSIKLGTFAHGLVFADGLFGIVKSDIEGACIWTLQWYNAPSDNYHYFKGVDYGFMKVDDNTYTTAGYVASELAAEMIGYDAYEMELGGADPGLNCIALKSPDGKTLKVIVVNYALDSFNKTFAFQVEGSKIRHITSKTLSARPDVLNDVQPTYSDSGAKTDGRNVLVDLKPFSMTVLLCDIGE